MERDGTLRIPDSVDRETVSIPKELFTQGALENLAKLVARAFQADDLVYAYIIAENTGADIFRIEPVTPYPLDHSELEDIAQKEQADNFRPEIAGTVENIEQYDTIFFGFPNWLAYHNLIQ